MLIALDATQVYARGKGVARALQNLVPRLVSSTASIRYIALVTAEGASLLSDVPHESMHVVPLMLGSLWEQVGLPMFARRIHADLVYSLRECGPLWGPPCVLHVFEDPVFRWRRTPPGAKYRIRVRYERILLRASLRRALRLVTSSESTKTDLVRRLGIPAAHVEVIPLGVDACFRRPRDIDAPQSYLFHLGSSDPRDNTLAVIQAYAILRARNEDAPPLLLAGALGDLAVEVQDAIERARLSGWIRVLGWVPDTELARLYVGATACLQPSSDEGFGLQPLEALAAGAPLIAVDTPAVREIAGGASLLIASPAPELIAKATGQVLLDKELSARLRAAGRSRASGFTWNQTVECLQDLFSRLLHGAT